MKILPEKSSMKLFKLVPFGLARTYPKRGMAEWHQLKAMYRKKVLAAAMANTIPLHAIKY
jgi:hypothetical protein